MKNTPPCLLLLFFSLVLPSNAEYGAPGVSVVELLHMTPCTFLERLTTVKTSPPCYTIFPFDSCKEVKDGVRTTWYVESNGTDVINMQKKWITMKDIRQLALRLDSKRPSLHPVFGMSSITPIPEHYSTEGIEAAQLIRGYICGYYPQDELDFNKPGWERKMVREVRVWLRKNKIPTSNQATVSSMSSHVKRSTIHK